MPISLPKMNIPTYFVEIPSTKKTIEFRPYLVAEEKILMLALESENENQIFNSVKKLLEVCTFNKVNIDNLTTFDLEYLFINLRSKSVGEIVEMTYKCEKCGTKNDVSINLNEVDLVWPKKKVDSKIMLTDTIGVNMSYPTIKNAQTIKEKSTSKEIFELISKCIKNIFDENNIYSIEDYSKEDINNFIDSLNHKQLEKITNFLSSIPVLKSKIKNKCVSCGHETEIELSGLKSFFS